MNDIAMRVEGLGKRYRLRASEGGQMGYRTFREELAGLPARLMGAWGADRAKTEFWALRDVSFEVKRGEVLGIIGRNGAGKSTLLKILSRIAEPSEGAVDIYGRVGSLLEVGTGFHPELTGRENIFLSGALLGMRRAEVRARFHEIVEFAGVASFIDMPCKQYSSGMYTRLGFAVAAHFHAEILLVDEVLAVGDAEFQRKCLGKMSEVAQSGRTVLFISHNLAALHKLCTSALLLEGGRAVMNGTVEACLSRYLQSSKKPENGQVLFEKSGLLLEEFCTRNAAGLAQAEFSTVAPITVIMTFTLAEQLAGLRCGFELIREDTAEVVFLSFDDDLEERSRALGRYSFQAVIPANLLKAGGYKLGFAAGVHDKYWITRTEVFYPFSIENISGVNARYNDRRLGVIAPLIQWEAKG